MEQCIDEMNKVIHIKCTEEEKKNIMIEFASYQLYDYVINFIIEENSTNQ